MSEIALIAVALALFAYCLAARRLSGWIVTGPMLFLSLGVGLDALGLVELEEAEAVLHILAEATLVVVLFSDASTVDFNRLRRRLAWPERMLIGGLPLAILFGFLVGLVLLPDWPVWELALLAAILAPTDAALGQAVVTNEAVPERVREALTVESGVNDGLALPAVLMFACIAVDGVHGDVQSNWLVFALEQIGLGAVAGTLVGVAGGLALTAAVNNRLTADAVVGVGVLALAALSYLLASSIGGNGFLAAFVGGLAFGAVTKGRCAVAFEFMENEGQLLVLSTFLLLGASVAPAALAHAEPVWILLILLSLFFVRPAAIWMSLWSSDAPPLAKGFMGWFGPRGLATALFALLVVEALPALEKGEEILFISVLAVLLSAALHGATAAPGARWYARRAAQAADDEGDLVE